MEMILDELIALMEPQAQRDKKLIVQCIDGLTEYAAELRQKAGDAGKAKSSALRELIDWLIQDIAAFWNCASPSLDSLCLQMQEALRNQHEWENTVRMGVIE